MCKGKRKAVSKMTAVLLTLMMAVTFIPTHAFASQTQAQAGTADDPILINSAEDFAAMSSENTGMFFKLNADITVTEPYASDFSGTFDGNNHVVTLGIEGSTNTALFKNLTSGATVENVITEGSVKATGNYTGSIAGKATGDDVTVEACVNYAKIDGTANLAGIVGWAINGVAIRNCANYGDVIGTSGNRVGGILAYVSGSNSNVTLENCANAGSVSGSNNQIGGIVGNVSGGTVTIENTYNTGAITGTGQYSNMLGGIIGQTTKSGPTDVLINCYNVGTCSFSQSTNTSIGAMVGNKSNNGSTANCYFLDSSASAAVGGATAEGVTSKTEEEMKAAGFVSALNGSGDAFIADSANINNGYPILKWQQTEEIEPVAVVSVEISGEAKTGATLNAVAKGEGDAEPTNVKYQWLEDDANIEGANGPTFKVPDVKESKGKIYKVVVTGDNESMATSDAFEITDLSDTLKVSLDKEALALDGIDRITETGDLGLPTAGENGSTIEWTSNQNEYITDEGKIVKLPETGKQEVTLTAAIKSGDVSDSKTFKCTVYSEDAAQAKAAIAKEKFDNEYALRPAFKEDKNIVQMVQKKVDGYVGADAVTVALKSSGDEDVIDASGNISYNNGNLNAYGLNSKNISCVFTFTYEGESVDTKSKNATIGWDQTHYNAKIAEEANSLSFDTIKGENTSEEEITSDLVLPQIMTNSSRTAWSKITWTSSNEDVIKIDPTGYDSVTDPKKGTVNRPGEDTEVTLTATFNANDGNLNENVEKAEDFDSKTVTFNVTVKKAEIPLPTEEELKGILEKYITADSFTKFEEEGVPVDPNKVTGDIQLPRYTQIKLTDEEGNVITDENGIPQLAFENKEISFTSSDESVMTINGYRAVVDRFQTEDKPVKLTVTFTRSGITVSEEFTFTVDAITDSELDAEIAKMKVVKDHYFDGINDGRFENKDSVTNYGDAYSDGAWPCLHAFQEANVNEEGEISWVYDVNSMTGTGIIADGYFEDSTEMEAAGYNKFRSSDKSIISHENLNLQKYPEKDAQITITSWLTSEQYKTEAKNHPDNEKLQQLYKQEVSATITVIAPHIHKLVHYDAKAATTTAEGNIEYWFCAGCGKYFADEEGAKELTKDEVTIPKKAAEAAKPAKKGTALKSGKAKYVVTSASAKNPTVSYKSTTAGGTVSIPATVKVKGVKYKVTSIAAKAFFKNKKIKKVTMGANIRTIGASAFSKCPKLKTVTIGTGVTKIGKSTFAGSKKVKTLTVKSKKLTKKGVKGSLKGSTVKTVKVKVGTKKVNKSYVKKYKKIFTKKNCGKKVTVK